MSTTLHLDPALTPAERATHLLSLLSLDEKMAQVRCIFPPDPWSIDTLLGDHSFGVGHVSALELRQATNLSEVAHFQRTLQERIITASPHGIPAVFHMEALCGAYLPGATSFPSGIARGAGWDPGLEAEIGDVIGAQQRRAGITYALAPVLDIARDPRMGRHGESYGEDPTLAAALGTSFTRGLQSSDPDGRTTESVAKHFLGSHAGEGGIHGTHADVPERLLLEIYAKPFQAAITEGGLRGIMPCYNVIDGQAVSSSPRVLTGLLRDRMGFDGVTVSDYGAIGNLHLHQGRAETLADAGEAALSAGMDAEWHVVMGYGEDLRDRIADGRVDMSLLDRAVHRILEAKFRMGLFEHPFAAQGLSELPSVSRGAELSLRSARQSMVLLRNDDVLPLRPDLRRIAVLGPQAANARFLFGGYTHLSMTEGLLAARTSMAGLSSASDEHAARVPTIPGTPVQSDENAAFDAVLDTLAPDTPTLLDALRTRLPDTEVLWARGHEIAGADESGHAEAVEISSRAEAVLVLLGGKYGTSSIATSGEGIDATSIGLPPSQETLLERLDELDVPVIGIHLDGRPLSSDVADRCCAALLEAWSPAAHGAQAIVDVLLGTCAPSGRLPVSVARTAGQIPVYYNHPLGSQAHQGDSVGFPEYLDAPHTPRYPFGHGLGYSQIEYEDLQISDSELAPADVLELALTVTNVGDHEAEEVVQLYLADPFSSMSRPVQELHGFVRVPLAVGESRRIRFSLPLTAVAFLDQNLTWLVEAGQIEVRVGASSEDIRLRETVRVTESAVIEPRTRGFWADSHVEAAASARSEEER